MAAGDIAIQMTITAVDAASSIVGNIADSLSKLPGGLGVVAGAAVAAGAAIVGIGASAATAAGNFEQSMERLVTSAGESQNNIKMLSDGILQMSVDTGTSTDQLAAGMYYIESSGIRAASGLAALKVAAEGAKSENADLTTVSKALTAVLTDYHMKVDDAASATASSTAVMNGLIKIVQNGKTNLQELSASMGAVLPTASSLGISFSQVAGVMDVMTNASIPAQQAAQNLSHVLLALSAPAAKAVTAMKDVGLSAQEVKDALVTKGLPAALQLIEDHIGKHLPAGSYQAEQALKAITGGIMGFKEAAILTGPNLKVAEDDIKAVAAAMGDASNGVMGWDIVQGEFNFKLDQAKAALNAFMIAIGEKLLPLLTPLVEGFTNFVSTITQWVQGIGDATASGSKFNDIGQLITSTFTIISNIFFHIGEILHTIFAPAFEMAQTAISNFMNNGLAQVLEGLNMFLLRIDQAVGAFSKWLAASGLVQNALQAIGEVITLVSSSFDSLTSSAFSWGANMMTGFENGIISVINNIISVVEQVAQEIANYLGFGSPTKKGPGSTLNSWGQGMMQGLAQGITASIPLVTTAVNQVAGTLSGALSGSGGTGIPSASSMMIDPLTGDKRKVTETSNARTSTNAIKGSGNAITSSLSSGISSGTSHVSTAVNAVGSQLSTLCSKHAQSTSNCAAHALTTGLAAKLHAGKGVVGAAAHAVGSQLSAVDKAAEAAAKRAAAAKLAAEKKAAAEAAKAAKAAAKLGPAPVAGASPVQDILGSDAIQKAVAPITKAAQDAAKAVTGALGPAATFVKNAWKDVSAFFTQVAANLKQAWQSMLPGLQDIWRVVQQQLVPALKELWTSIQPGVALIGQIAGGLVVGAVAFAKWATSASTLKPIWDFLVVTTKIIISILSTLIHTIADALAPVFKQLSDTFNSQLKPAWDDMIKSIQPSIPFWTMLAHAIGGLLVIAIGVLMAVLGGVIKGLGGLLAGLIQAVGGIVQIVSGFVQIISGILAMIYDLFTGNWSKLQKDNDTVWNGIVDVIKGVWNLIVGIFKGAIDFVVGTTTGFVQTIIKFFQNLSDTLVGHSIIPDMVNGIIWYFKDLWKNIVTLVSDLVKWVIKQFLVLRDQAFVYWNALYTGIVDVLKLIQNGVQYAISFIVNWLQKQWQTLQTNVKTAWDAVNSGITAVLKLIQNGIQSAITSILIWLQKQWQAFQTNVQLAWTGVQNIIKNATAGISTWLGTWIGGLIASAVQWGTNLMKSFADSITKGVASVTTAVTGVANKIKAFLGIHSPAEEGPLSTSDQWMPHFMAMLANGIKANTPKVTVAVTGVATQFTTLNKQADTSVNAINTKIGTLSTTFSTTSSKITSNLNILTSQIKTSSDNINRSVQSVSSNTETVSSQVGSSWHYIGWVCTTSSTLVQQANTDTARSCQQASSQVSITIGDTKADYVSFEETVNTTMRGITKNMDDGLANFNGTMSKWSDGMKQWTDDLQKNLNGFFDSNGPTSKAITKWMDDMQQKLNTWKDNLFKTIGDSVSNFFSNMNKSFAQGIQAAQSAAQQIANLLGHSKPKEGPLKDDDEWGEHFIHNIVKGIRSGIPEVQAVSNQLAGILVGGLAPSSSAFALPGGRSPGNPMMIYVSLDGKTIGKCVTKYQERELRVQGVVRNT